jgi:hypothetical protein
MLASPATHILTSELDCRPRSIAPPPQPPGIGRHRVREIAFDALAPAPPRTRPRLVARWVADADADGRLVRLWS